MNVPAKIPGLKLATILWAIYATIWIGLEGSLIRVLILAGWATAVALGHLGQRYLGGRWLSASRWLTVTSLLGFVAGITTGLLGLVFMSLKTGLHGHGPEFTPQEILWLTDRIPWWGAAGFLAGLGIGLVLLGLRKAPTAPG